MIDTHAHLNTETFEQNIKETLENAKNANVKQIIVVGMYQEANERGIDLTVTYDNLYASVGLHPAYVDEPLDLDLLSSQLDNKKVVALGEIGIDLHWVKDNLRIQQEVFIKQIELAISKDMPIIVHMRDSVKEIYDILSLYRGKIKGVMHCFSETLDWANKFLDLGFYIGIGGVVTFKNANDVKAVAKNIPIEKLLVETDSPYLSPMPYRGKINEPAYTALVLNEVAKLRDMDVNILDEQTTSNAKRLFLKMEE